MGLKIGSITLTLGTACCPVLAFTLWLAAWATLASDRHAHLGGVLAAGVSRLPSNALAALGIAGGEVAKLDTEPARGHVAKLDATVSVAPVALSTTAAPQESGYKLLPGVDGCKDRRSDTKWLNVGKPYSPKSCAKACDQTYVYFTISSGDKNCKCHRSCSASGDGHLAYTRVQRGSLPDAGPKSSYVEEANPKAAVEEANPEAAVEEANPEAAMEEADPEAEVEEANPEAALTGEQQEASTKPSAPEKTSAPSSSGVVADVIKSDYRGHHNLPDPAAIKNHDISLNEATRQARGTAMGADYSRIFKCPFRKGPYDASGNFWVPRTKGRRLFADARLIPQMENMYKEWKTRTPQYIERMIHDTQKKTRYRGCAAATKGAKPPYYNPDTIYTEFAPTSASPPIKVLVGIPTITHQCLLRNVHRRLWMTQEGICKTRRHDDPSCSVFVVFVFGTSSPEIRAGIEDADDHVFLDGIPAVPDENKGGNVWGMTRAMWEEAQRKTAKWFRHAYDNFPWATHVMKMDMDAMLFVPIFLNDMKKVRAKHLYYGKLAPGAYFSGQGSMFGQLYLMTRDLLTCWLPLAEHASAGKMWLGQPEDRVTAYFICKGVEKGTCPNNTLWFAVSQGSAGQQSHMRWYHWR